MTLPGFPTVEEANAALRRERQQTQINKSLKWMIDSLKGMFYETSSIDISNPEFETAFAEARAAVSKLDRIAYEAIADQEDKAAQ